MVDEADFDANLLALEIGDRVDAGSRYDHVVAVAVVVDHDANAGRVARACHERVAVGHAYRVHLAFGKRLYRRHVLEPNEGHVYARVLEVALLEGDFPSDPAGPIT